MPPESLPLLELFDELRRQADLPLGVDEYLVMLQALQAGLGVDHHGDDHDAALRRLCHILWTNSLQEQKILDYYFDLMLEKRRLAAKTRAAGGATGAAPGKAESAIPSGKEQEGKAVAEMSTPVGPSGSAAAGPLTAGVGRPPMGVGVGALARAATAAAVASRPDLVVDETQAARAFQAALQAAPAPTRQFVLAGDYLPVTRRQMKQSWRHLRSLMRFGPRVVLNVPATVQKMAHDGFLIEPVLEPRRANRIEVLLLVDRQGSMVPFHILADRLVESAQKGGRLARAGVFYFNNAPRDRLYLAPALVKARLLPDILSHLHPDRTVALIFSDAGAARGRQVQARVDLTAAFLQHCRSAIRRWAWINPLPQDRWAGTTAEDIAKLIPMFPFSRRGLDDAIDILRGRRLPQPAGR